VGWLVGPKNWQKPQKKFDFGGHQQCVVKDRDHLKANVVNLFVSSFFVCFLLPFTELFGQTQAFLQGSAIDS
jgi:hypothetical protein